MWAMAECLEGEVFTMVYAMGVLGWGCRLCDQG